CQRGWGARQSLWGACHRGWGAFTIPFDTRFLYKSEHQSHFHRAHIVMNQKRMGLSPQRLLLVRLRYSKPNPYCFMSYYRLSVPDLLHEAGKVSTNARDADLLARLDPAGYDETA